MARKKCKPTGKTIKKWLIDRDLTYAKLAEAMEVSHVYIQLICNDKRPAPVMRSKIKEYLKGVAA